MMKSLMLAATVLAGIALATPASAQQWIFGVGGFAGGLSGAGQSATGAWNLSNAAPSHNGTASANGQSFARAESGFGLGLGTLPANANGPGGSAADAYGNFVGATVMSGSLSNAQTSSNGGQSASSNSGFGGGSTSLSGAGAVIGGGVIVQ